MTGTGLAPPMSARPLALAAVLALAPLAAGAQTDDGAPLHDHLGAADFRACTDTAETTLGTWGCIEVYHAGLARGLGAALRVARERAAAEDADPLTPDSRPSLVAALDSAQAAWERYRDAETGFVYVRFWHGSGAGQFSSFRAIALTEERIDALGRHFHLEPADLGDL